MFNYEAQLVMGADRRPPAKPGQWVKFFVRAAGYTFASMRRSGLPN